MHTCGGSNLNDALLSRQVDFDAGGVPLMIVLWDAARGRAERQWLHSPQQGGENFVAPHQRIHAMLFNEPLCPVAEEATP